MAHQIFVVSVFHCVEGAFGASSGCTPKMKNGAPRGEPKNGCGRGWAVGTNFEASKTPCLKAFQSLKNCLDEARLLPRGSNDQKKFILDRNFQSRSKFLISLENVNLDVSISPQKIGPRWVARSKISFSIEIFNLDRNLEFFWSLGPLEGFPEPPSPGIKKTRKRVPESKKLETESKMTIVRVSFFRVFGSFSTLFGAFSPPVREPLFGLFFGVF